MTEPINTMPFLVTARRFPKEGDKLVSELSRSYVDIANAVNNRTIGLYPSTKPATNGEAWFLNQGLAVSKQFSNSKQQGLRQAYPITTTASFNHGLNMASIERFTNCRGLATDGTNWFGIIFAEPAGIAGQLTFYVSPTQIVFVGAVAITKGTIILEWIGF